MLILLYKFTWKRRLLNTFVLSAELPPAESTITECRPLRIFLSRQSIVISFYAKGVIPALVGNGSMSITTFYHDTCSEPADSPLLLPILFTRPSAFLLLQTGKCFYNYSKQNSRYDFLFQTIASQRIIYR